MFTSFREDGSRERRGNKDGKGRHVEVTKEFESIRLHLPHKGEFNQTVSYQY